MSFDLNNTMQSVGYGEQIKENLYSSVKKESEKYSYMRFSGPAVGFASLWIGTLTKVALVVEALLKGFVNILGSLFTSKCEWKRGLTQLFIEAPTQMICAVLSIFEGLARGSVTTAGMFVAPQMYPGWRVHAHSSK